ncbi:hypothetical protein CEXT_433401 [Caerostris extrusa]|uniref:Uncharacterized protein n=1 Tax=Caerostris extrusa TaxID=172846 RepID=A0AAV4UW60_CAEEX|nr:hypothetical protein CEXT_433401 [Caerostris extrusa]
MRGDLFARRNESPTRVSRHLNLTRRWIFKLSLENSKLAMRIYTNFTAYNAISYAYCRTDKNAESLLLGCQQRHSRLHELDNNCIQRPALRRESHLSHQRRLHQVSGTSTQRHRLSSLGPASSI